MFPKAIEQLVDYLDTFPDITRRQATRIVFYLVKEKKDKIQDFINLLSVLKKDLSVCPLCSNISQKSNSNLCYICLSKDRKINKIMVLEKMSELEKIEASKFYDGLYHIVGENKLKNFTSLTNPYINKLKRRIKDILKKYKKEEIELILAFSPTKEGEIKSLYLKELFEPYGIKITKIARGIPSGGEIEYFDKETLKESLIRRIVL